MPSNVLNQIKGTVKCLSHEERLWLIEHIIHGLRKDSKKSDAVNYETFETQLDMMAADPEIKAEIKKIDKEFAITEADGLAGG